MVKFRCPNCGQKISVNDEGVGADISCPNCVSLIVVPPRSAGEFLLPPAGMPLPALLSLPERIQLERLREAEARAEQAQAIVRNGLLSHLAKLMMNKLFRAVLSQRTALMDAQGEATLRIVDLEERMLRIQQQLQDRLLNYEQQVGELERELTVQREENRELVQLNFQLSRRALEAESGRRASRVDLRDAGFLLRA